MSDSTRVLFVEDHEGVRIAIAHLLKASGSDATAVESSFKALALLEQEKFDVVCTDLGLPEMDGGELIAEIRHRGIDTPIVLMSGSPRHKIDEALLGKPSPQAVIGKPAVLGELIETIARLAHPHEDSPREVQVA